MNMTFDDYKELVAKLEKERDELKKKASICDSEQCEGVLKWSTRFRESLEKAKKWDALLPKLEKIHVDNKFNINIIKQKLDVIEQENKRLLSDNQDLKYQRVDLINSNKKLKESLEKETVWHDETEYIILQQANMIDEIKELNHKEHCPLEFEGKICDLCLFQDKLKAVLENK